MPWTSFAHNSNPSFGDFTWKAYNDSYEMALIGNNVEAISNPFLERYALIEKYKTF